MGLTPNGPNRNRRPNLKISKALLTSQAHNIVPAGHFGNLALEYFKLACKSQLRLCQL